MDVIISDGGWVFSFEGCGFCIFKLVRWMRLFVDGGRDLGEIGGDIVEEVRGVLRIYLVVFVMLRMLSAMVVGVLVFVVVLVCKMCIMFFSLCSVFFRYERYTSFLLEICREFRYCVYFILVWLIRVRLRGCLVVSLYSS